MKFSKLTEEILKKAGWYEGRNIDINEYLNRYEKIDMKVNDKINKFLSEFGELIVMYPNYRVDNEIEELKISSNCASLLHYDKETQEYYEERTGESLIPVGEMYRRHLEVYISTSGAIYATDSDYMTKLGDDYISALETICHRKPRLEIEDIYDDE